MLLVAARIVNSTPLHDAPESPNEAQPITPHHLITQRDDSCNGKYCRPTNYSHEDLFAYGAQRWRRTEALADEFAKYWKHYIYQIGTDKEKWLQPQRNASVGDIVLLKDKQLSRLDWATGVIVTATPDKDGLVRKVTVQPHKQPGQNQLHHPKKEQFMTWFLSKVLPPKVIHALIVQKAQERQSTPIRSCLISLQKRKVCSGVIQMNSHIQCSKTKWKQSHNQNWRFYL